MLIHLTQDPPAQLLSAAEEKALIRAAQAGDIQARNTLIEHNMRLVIREANRYQMGADIVDDAFQEGIFGLIRAIEKFDCSKNFRLSTYALFWIRQAMARGVRAQLHAVSFPSHVVIYEDRLRIVMKRLASTSEEITVEKLRAATGYREDTIAAVLRWMSAPARMDAFVDEDEDATLGNFIAAPADAWDFAEQEEFEQLLAVLSEQERLIVTWRYNLGDLEEKPLTFDEIGRRLGLTKTRIQQVTQAALKKMYRRLQEVRA